MFVLVSDQPELFDRLTDAGYAVRSWASTEGDGAPHGSLTNLLRDVAGEPDTQVASLRATRSGPGMEDSAHSDQLLYIDLVQRRVTAAGKALELTHSEFGLLAFLAQQPGKVFERAQIIEAVKGSDYRATPRSIDVQVLGLRRKLGSLEPWIETVRGGGYRFAAGAAEAVRFLDTASGRGGESSS